MNLKFPVHCFLAVIIWEGCSVCLWVYPSSINFWMAMGKRKWRKEGGAVERAVCSVAVLAKDGRCWEAPLRIQNAGKNSKSGGWGYWRLHYPVDIKIHIHHTSFTNFAYINKRNSPHQIKKNISTTFWCPDSQCRQAEGTRGRDIKHRNRGRRENKTTERDKEKFVREEKWELYGTQLAVIVKILGQGKNNMRGEEKCEEMDKGGWVVSLFVLKEKLRNGWGRPNY